MRPLPSIAGQRFGRLVAVAPAEIVQDGKRPRRRWRCVCDCGREVTADARNLTSGGTKSCGCLRDESRRLDAARAQEILAAVERGESVADIAAVMRIKYQTVYSVASGRRWSDGAEGPSRTIGRRRRAGTRLDLRLSDPDLARWREAADRESLTLSEFVRRAGELAIARGSTR